jgi:hypothetical protein
MPLTSPFSGPEVAATNQISAITCADNYLIEHPSEDDVPGLAVRRVYLETLDKLDVLALYVGEFGDVERRLSSVDSSADLVVDTLEFLKLGFLLLALGLNLRFDAFAAGFLRPQDSILTAETD